MSKKARPEEPFFLSFVNINLLDGWRNDFNHIQRKEHLKNIFQKALKTYPEHKERIDWLLNHQLNQTDGGNIFELWINLKELISILSSFPDLSSHPRIKNNLIYIDKILENTKPALIWDDKKKRFQSGRYSKSANFISNISFELSLFLEQQYKPGLFSRCALEECEKYILTYNDLKYCCPAHLRRVYDQKRLKADPKCMNEYNKLNKRYNKYKKIRGKSFAKDYPDFKTYLKKHLSQECKK
jgi:hypothetical protein